MVKKNRHIELQKLLISDIESQLETNNLRMNNLEAAIKSLRLEIVDSSKIREEVEKNSAQVQTERSEPVRYLTIKGNRTMTGALSKAIIRNGNSLSEALSESMKASVDNTNKQIIDMSNKIKEMIPSSCIILSLAINSLLDSHYKTEQENYCNAYYEKTTKSIIFVALILLSTLGAQFVKWGRVKPCTTFFHYIVTIISVCLWISTTTPDYLVCFIADRNNEDKVLMVKEETYSLIELISGVSLFFWGALLMMSSPILDSIEGDEKVSFIVYLFGNSDL